MAHQQKLGHWGEDLAVAHLRKEGYKIVERNWRFGKEEIDIIAQKGEFLVIVEVKTRHSSQFGDPQDFVSNKQQRHLINAADAFVTDNDLDVEVRFDIIAITSDTTPPHLTHIEEAFYPTL